MANPIIAGLSALSVALSGTQTSITVGDSPAITIVPSGGLAPYSARAVGPLPPGRTLTNLLISGAFTTAGTSPYQVLIADAAGNTVTVSHSPKVAAAPVVVAPPAATVAKFKAALAKTVAGTADTTILALGDSLTEGQIADNGGKPGSIYTAYATSLVAAYNLAGIPAVLAGLEGTHAAATIADYLVAEPRVTLDTPGDWSLTTTNTIASGLLFNSVVGSKLHFNPGYVFDTIEWHGVNSGNTVVGIYLDGSSTAAATITQGSGNTTFSTTVSVPRGAHVIDLAKVSGGAMYVGMVLLKDSQTKRVRVINGGQPGVTAAGYAGQATDFNMLRRLAEIAPDLTLLELGKNEQGTISTPSVATAYTTAMQTIITAAKATGDVILAYTSQSAGGALTAAEVTVRGLVDQLVTANNLVAPLDVVAVLGGSKDAAVTGGYMSNSDIHLTAAGYARKGGTNGWFGKLTQLTSIPATVPAKDTNLYFTSNRTRIAQGSTFAVAAGHEYSMVVVEDVSPPYATNNWRSAWPDHYMLQAIDNAEVPLNGSVNVIGYAIAALISGTTWTIVKATFNNAAGGVVDPTATFASGPLAGTPLGGLWSDEVVFPQAVPANTRIQFRTIIQAAAGVSLPNTFPNKTPLPNYYTGQTPAYQAFTTGAPSDVFSSHLLDQNPTNSLGSTTGYQFAPVTHVARPVNGLDRPVHLIHGDSIANGSNQNGTQTSTVPGGAVGFLSMGMDDNVRSRRMVGYNMGASGTSATDMSVRANAQRRLNLIRQLPNRPYTTIISEHYTNTSSKDTNAATFTANMKAYYALIKAEGAAWGTAAPIYQVRPMIKSTSTNFNTDLAGQTIDPLTGGNFNRWPFDADLLSGVYTDVTGLINPNLALAQDQGSYRANAKVLAYSGTLTAAAASGQNVIVVDTPCAVTESVAINPGGTGQALYTVIAVSADGLTVTLDGNLATAWAAGTVVKKTLKSDALHPSTQGHYAAKSVIEDWKVANFGF